MQGQTHNNLLAFSGATPLLDPLDLHKYVSGSKDRLVNGKLNLRTVSNSQTRTVPLETSWLKFASKKYNISSDIEDYVMVPISAFYANIPNRNGVGFLLKDLVEFMPDFGRASYKTWKGKPVLYEHSDHEDPTTAKGVVLDTMMRKDNNHWKMLAYLAVDRTKDQKVSSRILSKNLSSYSIGALVSHFECSLCGTEVGKCAHLNPKSHNYSYGPKTRSSDNVRASLEMGYAVGKYPVGIEISIVENPAYPMAVNDRIQLPT